MLLELFRFLLVATGVIYILTRSILFRRFRMTLGGLHILIATLVFCPGCAGFWIGLVLSLPLFHLWPNAGGGWDWLYAGLTCCGLGSVLNEIWDKQQVLEEFEVLYGAQKEGSHGKG